MTPEEVLAAEGRAAFDVEYIDRSQGTSQGLLQNVYIGSFHATIVCNFLNDRLVSASIVPEEMDAEMLEQMMALVYGQVDKEASAEAAEGVTSIWQTAPDTYVCVVSDEEDGVYLCYYNADAGFPTELYVSTQGSEVPSTPTATAPPMATPQNTPAPTATSTPTPTPTPTSAPESVTPPPVVTAAPTAVPTPTPQPTCEPNLPLDREESTEAPSDTSRDDVSGDEDVIGGDEEDCEPNLPLDREESTGTPSDTSRDDVSGDEDVIGGDEEDCEPNLPLDREESTGAPSDTSRDDVSGDEDIIGGDEEDCEPNEDSDIYLDP